MDNNDQNRNDRNRGSSRGILSLVIWALVLTFGFNYITSRMDQQREAETSHEIAYSEFKELVRDGKIASVEFGDRVFTIEPVEGYTYTDETGKAYDKNYKLYTTIIPDGNETLIPLLDEYGVDYTKPYQPEMSMFTNIMLTYILPTVVMVGLFLLMMRILTKRGGMGGFGGIGSVGKANAKVYMERKTGVTFADVAGQDEAKESLVEIIDFLHNPEKYTAIGAKIPKGALLVGAPGTGKTLLAKAVAGEANVPFFSISGSDFVEMFVGVGASRVRDLFRQAKEKAPCIVFIDEIDAVGRARAKNGGFTSNDERENTLNQLLTEMDGFGTNSGVIVLAATNRADILDQALMRAGRFDRQIHVELPELKEREEIFQVHLRGIKVDPDFNVEFMAKHTPGFSGADIANVCNEAALTAARRNHATVNQQDFLDAVDRIIGGLERKNNTIMSPAEKRTTAYHEAGHALVGWLLPYADPVFKVSIIPRGNALGLTWYLPEERKNWSRSVMIDRMCALIGGRVAEEILNGEPSTGALNDLERMTGMAYSMVQYYGMSEKVGNLSFYDSTGARGYNLTKPYSEKTAELMDEEVKAIVREVHDRTYRLIEDHKEGFMQMGALLLEKEVIFAEDIEQILGPKVKPAEEDQPVPDTEEHE